MWLVKCVKSLVSEDRATENILNSLENYKTALPSFFFFTFTKTDLDNVRLSVSEILGVFVNTLPAN